MNKILSQEEYKNLFLNGTECVKRECYADYISQRLAEEFGMIYNCKAKCWHSEWNNNWRFVAELHELKGNHIVLRWGYNYDFIPDITNQKKLVWHRTDKSIKIHIDDAWYNHIDYDCDQEWGFSEREFYNPEQCPFFQYAIPTCSSDVNFALGYIKNVIDKNIILMHDWKENVKTLDDAIDIMNQRVLGKDVIHIPRMHYILAFLFAKNKNMVNSMSALEKYYDEREIPSILLKKINQLATEQDC